MSKKITLPKYEQMILDIGTMNQEQLETVIRCAKRMLADLRPRVTRKKKAPEPKVLAS